MMLAVIPLLMQVAVSTRDDVVQKFSSRWRRCFIIIHAGAKFPHRLHLNFIAGNTVSSKSPVERLGHWSGCNTMLHATDVEHH